MSDTYELDPLPLYAPIAAHAATLARHWFAVSPRTIESWPVSKVVINGKRQPDTIEVWAVAASLYHDEAALLRALAALPPETALEIRRRVPAAREALAAVKAAKRARYAA
jgi:hypothetical protein